MSSIAAKIIKQLGGQRFKAMTGADNLLLETSALIITLDGTMTRDRANRVRIALTSDDTYVVESMLVQRCAFGKGSLKPSKTTVLQRQTNIEADCLQACFGRLTGLAVVC
jgi:hypothetical protein